MVLPVWGDGLLGGAERNRSQVQDLRYSGKERDATGLYYYGFRYYHSERGRWLNADPAGEVDGLNLYRMVRNNPISKVDDYGTESRTIGRKEHYLAKIMNFIPATILNFLAPTGASFRPGRLEKDGGYRPSNSFKIKKLSNDNARDILVDFEKKYTLLDEYFMRDNRDISDESIDNVRIAAHLASNMLTNFSNGNKYALVDKNNTPYAIAQLTTNEATRTIEVNMVMAHPYTQFSRASQEELKRIDDITSEESKIYTVKGVGNVLASLAILAEIKAARVRLKTVTTNAINIRSQNLAKKLGATQESKQDVQFHGHAERRDGFRLSSSVDLNELNIFDATSGRLYI